MQIADSLGKASEVAHFRCNRVVHVLLKKKSIFHARQQRKKGRAFLIDKKIFS